MKVLLYCLSICVKYIYFILYTISSFKRNSHTHSFVEAELEIERQTV